MAVAVVEFREPQAPETLESVKARLARSFTLQSFVYERDTLSVTVVDEIAESRLMALIVQMLRAERYLSRDMLFEHRLDSAPAADDPQPALEAMGEVQALGPGLFAFRGGFLRVREALNARMREIGARHAAEEVDYPPLWPVEVLRDINYLHDFPHLVMLAAGVDESFAQRARFAERYAKSCGHPDIACAGDSGLDPARHGLAPTVCDCCYWLLRGRLDVADQVFTTHGRVFRNERSADARLDRLTAYTMREVVGVGSESFVLAFRDAMVAEMSALMVALDLRCEIKAADDPFFSNDALQKNAFQNMARLKYEVVVPLFGDRQVAVASVNLHRDFFSRSYGYSAADGSAPHSACVGIGFERLAYALFCRYGARVAEWPTPVRAFLAVAT